MVLDLRSGIYLMALSAFLMGLGTLWATYSYTSHVHGIKRWVASRLVQGVSWILLSQRGHISDFSSVTLSNVLLTLSVTMGYHALLELKEKPGSRVRLYWPTVAIFILFVLFTHVWSSQAIRMVLIFTVNGALLLACARLLLLDNAQDQPSSYRLTGIGFLICGTLSILRPFLLLFGLGADPLPNQATVGNSIVFALLYSAIILVTFGFLLMCSDKFHAELYSRATLDWLTGSLNRGTIELLLQKEIHRARRRNTALAVLLVDIDHFKDVNDTYGHTIGDQVIKSFADLGLSQLRSHDLIGRYGGEEFLIVLPETSLESAHLIGERLRTQVGNACLSHEYHDLRCTISIGLSALSSTDEDYLGLLRRADMALYRAKSEGRDRIVAALPDELEGKKFAKASDPTNGVGLLTDEGAVTETLVIEPDSLVK